MVVDSVNRHCSFSTAKFCPTLCHPHGLYPLGSTINEISQARILEWVAISLAKEIPTQGSNPHLLHWQAGSLPRSHQDGKGTWWEADLSTRLLCQCCKLSARLCGFAISVHTLLFSYFLSCLHQLDRHVYGMYCDRRQDMIPENTAPLQRIF